MEFTGQAIGVSRDYTTNKFHITFSVNENASITCWYDKIKDINKLTIKAVKYKKKRSHDANAYAWVLMQKIAEAIHSDKWSVYLNMLPQYGVFTHLIVKPNVVERVKMEWRAVKELGEVLVNGVTGIQLQCYFGSSTYDTSEMSRFIDGIVKEAKELGIETLTPDELAIMKKEWCA